MDTLSTKTRAYILKTLSPVDLRGPAQVKNYWIKPKTDPDAEGQSPEPRPAKKGVEDQTDPAVSDAILDRLIMSFNRDHL